MTLRLKLLATLAPMAIALAVVGAIAVMTVTSLGRTSEAILRDNYRSVLAAQRMKDTIERLQELALRALVLDDQGALAAAAAKLRPYFDHELSVQGGNITEPGEREAVQRLSDTWADYQHHFDSFVVSAGAPSRIALWQQQLEPGFVKVRQAVDEILALNQDAIVRKNEHARREASRMNMLMIVTALAAFGIGAIASATATARVLRPLGLLRQTVRRIGEGQFEARANVSGHDEIADLAATINGMAQKLSHYRRSSLGELLLAQQASQAAIDSVPDPVIVFDSAGQVLNCNRAAEQLIGVRLEGGGTPALSGVAPEVRATIEETRAHVLSGKGAYVPKGFEEAVRVATADGERYLLPRSTPVYSEAGAIGGATVILQDVTRLRRVDELRGNLVATVAHELRTPLTSLRMAIHLLIEQTAGPLTDKQADLLYATREDCVRLQSTVDELLDLARIQGGHIELRRQPTAVGMLVDAAVDAFRGSAEANHVLLDSEVMPGLGDLEVDRDRLHVVLSNLLANALRYTPGGGQVSLRAVHADRHVRFEVTDTGPGIPAEYQQSIFDKFVRVPGAPQGGAGIGLAIAKEIVEAHGGEIGVRSIPGQGATFWFTVPRTQPN